MAVSYKNSEKWIERELTRRVKAIGGKALKFSSNVETGYPDRIVLMPNGKIYWCEIKSKGKKPTKLQILRHDSLRALKQEVFVIASETDLSNFIGYLINNNL